ncbi:unnamed protein product [Calicophoron daubneyi]|uniref:Protein TAPT1 homolog n=1 Tax=Calicophoron daubneyi TaxID=300641 RepID=A0AAV2T9A9_CALDB
MRSSSPSDRRSDSESEVDVRDPFKKFRFFSYLKEEVVQTTRKDQERSGTEDRGPFTNRVYTFVAVPHFLESFMFYGLIQCVDHLLVIYTFLPVRCLLAVLRLFLSLISRLIGLFSSPYGHQKTCFGDSPDTPLLYSHEIRDFVRLSLLSICTVTLAKFDTSVIYHEIRTQSVMKIYIFFNLLEVADRLLSAVCQDALDDLLHTVSKRKRNDSLNTDDKDAYGRSDGACQVSEELDSLSFIRDLVFQYSFALACLFAHCFLLVCQVTTLNVAFNSQNRSLVTVFISNNFVELKSNVFRRMGKTNLFQIACADVRERFHYLVWLSIVVARNMTDTGWNIDDLWPMLFDVLCIFLAEVAVDWIKHAFIAKFNVIPSNVYEEYTVSIAYDLLLCRQGKNTADYFDLLSRRMGLTPIPLSCLINVMMYQTVRNPGFFLFTLPLILPVLFLVKLCANMLLLFLAYSHVKAYIQAATATQQKEDVESDSKKHDDKPVSSQATTASKVGVESCTGVTSWMGPNERLIPVHYTGYDQPTKDDDQLLPMLLRHRRIHSVAGFTDTAQPESALTDPTSLWTGSSLGQGSGGLPVDNPIQTTSSMFTARGDEPNVTKTSSRLQVLISEDSEFKHIKEDEPPEPSICDTGHFSGRESPDPIMWELRSPTPVHFKAEPSRSAHFRIASTPLRPSAEATPSSGLISHHPVPSFDEDEGNRPEAPEIRSQCIGEKDVLPKPPSMGRSRSYSIDLGVLSTFNRLSAMAANAADMSAQLAQDQKTQAGSVEPTGVKTAPIGHLRKRRMRTLTEGSQTNAPRSPLDSELPIMWERSSRNSTTVKPFTPIRPNVKQPLSDIDRYSMLEGQIS